MIGVLINKEGKLTDFFNWEKIEIYKEGFFAEPVTIFQNTMDEPSGLLEVRTNLEKTAQKLQGCRILLGTSFSGLPYQYFDSENFVLCESKDYSSDIMAEIINQLDKIEEDQEIEFSQSTEEIALTPVPIDHEGNYFLDFLKLQKYHPELTSKKVLLPFFATELFQTITIICSHKMPWLDVMLEQKKLECSEKRENGVYTLLISHKACK